MHREPVRRELAFKDALPDLIIGLVGIPVGFSLLEVASATLTLEGSKQWEGLVYFALIVLLYGLCSGSLYMLVEVGQRLTNQLQLPDSQRRVAWQRYLVKRALGSLPFTVLMVAMLVAAGVIFELSVRPDQAEQAAQFFNRPLDSAWSALLILLSFTEVGIIYAMVFTAAPRNVLMDEYPVVMPYYTAAMAAGFVGSLVVFFTFMN